MKQSATKQAQEKCPYCGGKGYFQLLLGGSETCAECGGSGKNK
ncbi:YuiA family protein [Fictibacillus sp. Mic-4]|nr:YuiA family protein [Fictibacillus gelatini]